jgi:hypothetical protein
MLCDPNPRWLMQEITQEYTGLSWFRPRGRTSSKRVCECTVLSCTGVPVVGEYKRGERGREAPKSLLSDRCKCQYQAPKRGNVFCESCVREDRLWKKEPTASFYRHKKDRSTCTGRSEVVVFSPNWGCAVNVYCRKYTVWHWRSWHPGRPLALRGSRRHPAAPVGGVVVAVEGIVLHA